MFDHFEPRWESLSNRCQSVWTACVPSPAVRDVTRSFNKAVCGMASVKADYPICRGRKLSWFAWFFKRQDLVPCRETALSSHCLDGWVLSHWHAQYEGPKGRMQDTETYDVLFKLTTDTPTTACAASFLSFVVFCSTRNLDKVPVLPVLQVEACVNVHFFSICCPICCKICCYTARNSKFGHSQKATLDATSVTWRHGQDFLWIRDGKAGTRWRFADESVDESVVTHSKRRLPRPWFIYVKIHGNHLVIIW
jgi:hypothetical protein